MNELNRVKSYMQWKLKKNNKYINEVQIKKYLEVSDEKVNDILKELLEVRAIVIETRILCPSCSEEYIIESEIESIECKNCEQIFIPNNYRRHMIYKYRINEYYREFKEQTCEQQVSLISEYRGKGENKKNMKKLKVFLSYSHADEEYKTQLDKHLSALKRIDSIESWNDRMLTAGEEFDAIIKQHLLEDDIIILLISSDFIDSDYCCLIEMQQAIERCKREECVIVPVILRPCLWQVLDIKQFLVLPQDGKPVTHFKNRDDAYLEIVNAVFESVKKSSL